MKKELHEIRDMVVSTKFFDKLSPFQKRFAIKLKNIREIEHDLNVIESVGFGEWNRSFNPTEINKSIITEIYKNGNK